MVLNKGSKPTYVITYKRCCEIVDAMKTQFQTDVFGVEKEHGKVEGILASIYQSAFGEDAYPSLEEKAANLLYFFVKDHPYNDGCKRIAASLFLDFLSGNDIFLYYTDTLGKRVYMRKYRRADSARNVHVSSETLKNIPGLFLFTGSSFRVDIRCIYALVMELFF